jgi:protein subunit release factor A
MKKNEKIRFNTRLEGLLKETKVFYYRSRGPGGQRKNKKETAVRLYHIPSGLTVIATEHRFQAKNKELAFSRLQKKLQELNKVQKPRIPTKISASLKEKVLKEKKIRSEKKRLRKKVKIPPE